MTTHVATGYALRNMIGLNEEFGGSHCQYGIMLIQFSTSRSVRKYSINPSLSSTASIPSAALV